MFKALEEKAEEKAMVQFLSRFTDYPFLVKFKDSEYTIGEGKPDVYKRQVPESFPFPLTGSSWQIIWEWIGLRCLRSWGKCSGTA